MEWKVQNALNRDVERQHLNKILKEIEAAVKASSSSSSPVSNVKAIVGEMVENNREVGIEVEYDPVREVLNFSIVPFTLHLVGDVTGTATVNGLGTMTLNTTLELDALGVEEAPMDGFTYWRRSGEWEQVADLLTALENVSGSGFAVVNGSSWEIRSLAAVDGELVVTNPTGIGGNPTYGLADVPNSGNGDGVVRTYTRDEKGRIVGDEEATTDGLLEGDDNLYFTEERVRDVTTDLLQNSDDIHFEYDENVPALYAHLSQDVWDAISNVLNVVGTPTDADIIEYDEAVNGWVPKKNPRELLIDGGNF